MSVVHSILAVMPWSLHISVRCAALTLLWLINNYVGAQDALIPGVSVVTGVNSTLVDDELWSDLEKGAFSYSIYVHVDKPISSRIMFEVGLGLARKRYRITNDNLQWPAQVDSNFLFDPTIMPGGPDDIVRFQYHSTFLQIPLSLHYTLSSTSAFYLSAGASPMIHMGSGYTVRQKIMDVASVQKYRIQNESIRFLHLGVHGGIGYRGVLSKGLTFLIEPGIEIIPLGIYKDAILNRGFLSGGCKFSIIFGSVQTKPAGSS